MEIGSLTGNIGMEGDRPFCHLHAVVSPRELLAYAGHLHEARVGVVVEVFVIVMDGVLSRVVDPATGFARIVLPGESPPASAAGD
jgi:predicted DNA-binding protein with PD1-like motif